MTLDRQKKKELADTYAKSFRRMGIYQLRNTVTGKVFVNAHMDLHGAENLLAFSRTMNAAPYPELKEDWDAHGGESFVFEVLDELKPREESPGGREEMLRYKKELAELLELWLEKLEPYGERGYNKPKRRP